MHGCLQPFAHSVAWQARLIMTAMCKVFRQFAALQGGTGHLRRPASGTPAMTGEVHKDPATSSIMQPPASKTAGRSIGIAANASTEAFTANRTAFKVMTAFMRGLAVSLGSVRQSALVHPSTCPSQCSNEGYAVQLLCSCKPLHAVNTYYHLQ